jgi:hypothetical protein
LIDGWNREIKNVSKAVAWRSDPVELQFAHPEKVACLHVSLANRHNQVSFAVDAFVEGAWKELTRTGGKRKQRRYVINVEPVVTDQLRFRLIRSSAPVSIAEIRVYAQPGDPTKDGLAQPAAYPSVIPDG